MERNSYILRKSFWTFFIASVLSSLAWSINTMADGIIVSQMATPDALSAIGVVSPILSLLFVIASIICSGSAIIVSNMIGKQKYIDASKTLLVCLCTITLFYVLLGAVLSCFDEPIARLVTNDPVLLSLLEDYLPLTLLGMPVMCASTAVASFVRIAGRPQLVTSSVLAYCIANIVLDLLFTGVFHMGIRGAALASLLSAVISLCWFLPYFSSDDCLYCRVFPDMTFFRETFPNTINTGLPSGVNTVSFSLMMFFLNTLVQKTAGTDGIFILTVGLQVLMFCFLIIGGTGNAISSIGGVLIGEEDVDSYRGLVNGIIKKSFAAVLLLSLILFMFPETMARAFGASGEMLDRVSGPLRQFTLILAPFSLMNLLSISYVVLGHRKLTSILSFLSAVFILASVWFICVFIPEQLWSSIPVAVWSMLILFFLTVWIYSCRISNVNHLTLIPIYPNDPAISRSVSYSNQALKEVLKEFRLFISICELSQDDSDRIFHCIEELSLNIINMANTSGKDGYFDVRVVQTPEKLLVVFKDDNRPYNPIFSYKQNSDLTAEEENLCLVLLNSYCLDINYTYMNGINCTYLNFPVKQSMSIPVFQLQDSSSSRYLA